MRDPDKFKGCMIGGAAGDALGYAVEFMSAGSIFSRYGEGGITRYALRDGLALISDDTQMTMFTAAGLLSAAERGSQDYTGSVNAAYLSWYRTQTECWSPVSPGTASDPTARLMGLPELFSPRAPGNTCMSALASGGNGSLERPLNGSAGCGGVMRVAPVGLFFCQSAGLGIEASDMLAAQAAALTHGGEMGYIPAAALAHIVRREAGDGAGVREAAEDALEYLPRLFPNARRLKGFSELLRRAVSLAGNRERDLDNIRSLGEGWVGNEALAIAVYCAVRYDDDLERCLIAAVNHSGDSDSTGAVAGNILGAHLGYGAVPEKFTADLELRDAILELAEDLCSGGKPA